MIRLTHLSGSQRGTVSSSPKAVVRIGRGADCDVRFDAQRETRVSTHHAEIRFESGHYVVIDTGSANGTLVNGKLVRQKKLREGDRIAFGAPGGPEVKFEVDFAVPANGVRPNGAAANGAPPGGDAAMLAQAAQRKIAEARVVNGGQPSGQTMFIMADTLRQVEQVTERRDSRRTAKIVLALVVLALAGFGALGGVIWEQKQQIEKIAHKKQGIDRQIQKIQLAMQLETDPDRLAALEEQLDALTGKAQAEIGEMAKKDKAEAVKLAESGDELDREIRRILQKFSATTYAVPPIFKERLQFHVAAMLKRADTRAVYRERKKYWTMIIQEFSARGLPEEMAYVAWTESHFNPLAENPSGARGMWQLMAPTARHYGLRVDGRVDERTDPQKSTRAAAHYLYELLSEFGEDSFMLAIASYNKGEQGVRRVLHGVGFRKEQRDFWHLYRLKKLPEETMEYVPQILAAAIINNNPQKYGLE